MVRCPSNRPANTFYLQPLPKPDSNNWFSTSVVTGSGHPGLPGHPGHVLSGSSGSDPLRNLSGSDPDWITCEIIY